MRNGDFKIFTRRRTYSKVVAAEIPDSADNGSVIKPEVPDYYVLVCFFICICMQKVDCLLILLVEICYLQSKGSFEYIVVWRI